MNIPYTNIRPLSPLQYLESQVHYLRYLANNYSPLPTQKSVQTSRPATSSPVTHQPKQAPYAENRRPNPYDEIPIKSLPNTFETVTDKEPKFFSKLKRKTEPKAKQSFLKRKSQKVVPNKATTPNVLMSQSKLAKYLRGGENFQDFLECDEKSKEDVIKFPVQREKYSIAHKNNTEEKTISASMSPKKKQGHAKSSRVLTTVHQSQGVKTISNRLKKSPSKFPLSPSSKKNSNSTESLKLSAGYNKKIKEIEEKLKNIENDTKKFAKMRETELKSLQTFRSETTKNILKEKKSLESLQQKRFNPSLSTLHQELSTLSYIVSNNEAAYSEEIEKLKELIEYLSQQNSELLQKMHEKPQEYLDSKSLQSLSEISGELQLHIPSTTPTKIMNTKPQGIPTFTLNLPSPKNSSNTQKNKENKPKEAEKIHQDGKKEIFFSNGVKKEVFPDGLILVNFKNKDKKELFPDGRTVYHFHENKIVQTTFSDGLLVIEFPSGQVEKHFVDGSKEIKFSDGTVKCIFCDGQEESMYPDGTLERIGEGGVRVVEYANGVKDTILLDGSKVRVLADGSVRRYSKSGKLLD